MKKYSTEDFKKKYNILFERLVQKEGFMDEIKEQRKSLGIPENGFRDTPEFAEFLFKKLKKDEKRSLTFLAFLDSYAIKNKVSITEENREELIEAFFKEGYEEGISMLAVMVHLSFKIENHHTLLSQQPLFIKSKKLSKFSIVIKELVSKYWDVDLLDSHIYPYYLESYFFLGELLKKSMTKNINSMLTKCKG